MKKIIAMIVICLLTSEWIQYGVNESVGSGTYSQLLPAIRAGYTYAWRVEVWER